MNQVKSLIKELQGKTTIVAASKSRTADEIISAYKAGIRIFGENYVQEAEAKILILKQKYPNIKFHLIGHLQSNKVKKAIGLFDVIQTVDSVKLAEKVNKAISGKKMPIFIQVNIGAEESKYGCRKSELFPIIQKISSFHNLHIIGLMAMPPFSENPNTARLYFEEMNELYLKAKAKYPLIKYLSMGMSKDYKIAVESGSNMVRLGTVIFGPRREK